MANRFYIICVWKDFNHWLYKTGTLIYPIPISNQMDINNKITKQKLLFTCKHYIKEINKRKKQLSKRRWITNE